MAISTDPVMFMGTELSVKDMGYGMGVLITFPSSG